MTREDPRALLNILVTESILEAERLADAGSPKAKEQYEEVSRLEEAIAALHPADDIEGAIARVGAVTAALHARKFDRARELALRFVADPKLANARRDEIAAALGGARRLKTGGADSSRPLSLIGPGRQVYVQPRPDGQWEVKKRGNERASAVTETRREAVSIGRDAAKKERSELVIVGKDGRIQHKGDQGPAWRAATPPRLRPKARQGSY